MSSLPWTRHAHRPVALGVFDVALASLETTATWTSWPEPTPRA